MKVREITNFIKKEFNVVEFIYLSLKCDSNTMELNGYYTFKLVNQLDIQKLLKLHEENESLNIHLNHIFTETFNIFGKISKPVFNMIFFRKSNT